METKNGSFMTTSVAKDHGENQVILIKHLLKKDFTHVKFYSPYDGILREYFFYLLPRGETMNLDVYCSHLQKLNDAL